MPTPIRLQRRRNAQVRNSRPILLKAIRDAKTASVIPTIVKDLGAWRFERMTDAEIARLSFRLRVVWALTAFYSAANIRFGALGRGLRAFIEPASRVFGRRLSYRSLERWHKHYHDYGVRGLLLTGRGRTRGNVAVDGVIWRMFREHLKRGAPIQGAWAVCNRRARRERRPWCSECTARKRLTDGQVVVIFREGEK